jgi:hypothetical protein
MERRTLIRLLIVLAIAIPVLVEAVTFFGLLEAQLVGGDGEPTATPTADRVGVGDELLPATPPTETVTDAVIRGQDTPWLFVLTVEVQNPTDAPYELQLETLTLGSGQTVAGGASTGRVPPGGTGQVTGAWEIPEGSTPAALAVRAIAHREDGRQETTAVVDLAKVPVRGG